MLSSDVGGKPETSHGVVTYHKVTLKGSTDGTTAKEQVVRRKSEATSVRGQREEHEDLER